MDALLPEPTITFTIPSVNDATTLSCRIYHPLSLSGSSRVKDWRGQAAVFSHPYGPLGGCADDHVVGAVAGSILRKGFVVCTFNFRGAGDSGGRTSWTAKGERADYVSVAAFTTYYAHFLYSMAYGNEAPLPGDRPVLVLGGYSYGSMITSQVPPLEDILQPFTKPDIGSAAAEIRLRAEHLAEQQAEVLRHLRELGSRARGHHGIRVGGTESGEVRGSSEGRHSFIVEAEEKIRRSIEHAVARTKRHSRGRSDGSRRSAKDGERGGEVEGKEAKELEEKRGPVCLDEVDLRIPRVGYVLVSPLQGFITHLATMSFMPSKLPSFLSGLKTPSKHTKDEPPPQADVDSPDAANIIQPDNPSAGSPSPSDKPDIGAPPEDAELKPAELKLAQNPTLAVFGDRDVFVSAHKLRSWAGRMRGAPGSKFHPVEVSSAGHFWVEERVLGKLVGVVGGFVAGLVDGPERT